MNKKQKNAQKYPYPYFSITNKYIISFNRLKGISWSKSNVMDF